MNHLYENAWVDHAATVTFVEFTIYNVNTNLFSQVRFASEWLPSGGSSNAYTIKTFRLYHYTGAAGAFMMVAQLIFMIHLIYKIYSTVRHGFMKLGFTAVLSDGWQCYEAELKNLFKHIIARPLLFFLLDSLGPFSHFSNDL